MQKPPLKTYAQLRQTMKNRESVYSRCPKREGRSRAFMANGNYSVYIDHQERGRQLTDQHIAAVEEVYDFLDEVDSYETDSDENLFIEIMRHKNQELAQERQNLNPSFLDSQPWLIVNKQEDKHWKRDSHPQTH